MKTISVFMLLFIFLTPLYSQPFGRLAGRIVDEDGLGLPGANIVLPELESGTASDAYGEFYLASLPIGAHKLYVKYIGFHTYEDTILIKAGQTTFINVSLSAEVLQLDKIVVVGERLRGQSKALNQQKENDNVSTIVSSDQIGRFPDQNIGDALKRLPGVTVNYNQGEARYANLRGVGPTLNSVTIDGDAAPSADAETRAVQLDLIPAEMIQSIEVHKTVTPDMDGDAIGGVINLITRRAPHFRRLALSVGGGLNALGMLPRFNSSIVLGKRFCDEKLGLSFSGSIDDNRMTSHNSEGVWRPDKDIDFVPQQWDIRLYRIRRLRQSYTAAADYRLNDRHRFFVDVMFNHRDDWENRVRLRYLPGGVDKNGLAQKADIRRQTKGGITDGRNGGARLEDQRMHNIRIKGKHNYRNLLQIEWSLSLSRASEQRPHERYINWEAKNVPVQLDLSNIRTPLFQEQIPYNEFELEEISEEYRNTIEKKRQFKVDLDLPLIRNGPYKSTFFFGGKLRMAEKRRDQHYDQFKLTSPAKAQLENMTKTPTADFSVDPFLAGNYELGQFTTYDYLAFLDFQDTTLFKRDDDPQKYIAGNYKATEDISAAYIMLKQKLGKKFRLTAGLRLEQTNLETNGYAWNDEDKIATATHATDAYTHILPGLHFKYEPDKKTVLRAAWTNTISRPNYYDLVPYRGTDRGGEVLQTGNPELRAAFSHNIDFSAERYFESIGLLSAALFSKRIENFIFIHKQLHYKDSLTQKKYDEFYQPRNGDRARLWGIELSYQRQLSFLPGYLSNLGIYLNYTYTYSRAWSNALPALTQLPGAAPHSLNANVTYETNHLVCGLSLAYSSPYIDPDEVDLVPGLERYYDRVTYLDFNAAYKIGKKLCIYCEGKNLLNQPLRYYAGTRSRTAQQEFYHIRVQAGLKVNFSQ